MSKAFFFAFFFYGVNSFKPNYLKISSTSFLKVSQQSETQLFESSWQTKQIKAEGIFHSHFESPCGNIRGLASNRLVQPNEFVVSVPVSECMIIPEESSRMDSGPVNFKGTTYLALYLLDEWKLQSKSKFYGYIAQLPNHLSSPIHWSDEMLTTLPYEKILCNVLQQKNKLKSVYDHLRSRAISIEYDYDRFLWAMEMVGSRSFKGIGGIKHFNAPKIGGILSAIILSGAAIASQLPNQETLMVNVHGIWIILLTRTYLHPTIAYRHYWELPRCLLLCLRLCSHQRHRVCCFLPSTVPIIIARNSTAN